MKLHQALGTNNFSCKCTQNYTGICKQMNNVLWCFKVVWLPHYHFFRLVGSKQILSFKLPSLSFPSTNTKLLIQGVASCTGFRTPTLSILLISCWKASFKCTRIGLQSVCMGVILGYKWIWYGGPGKHPIQFMTSDVVMAMDGWWCHHVFFEPFCKFSFWFSSVPILTVHPSTLVPVDHSTLLQDGVPIFGVYQEVPDGVASSEIHFNPMFSADVFAAFTHALHRWDCYVGCLAACVVLVLIGPLFGSIFASGQFQHSGQGGPEYCQGHQRGNIN